MPAARGRMSALAILGVPMGSGEHQRSGGTGSDSREGRPEMPHPVHPPALRGAVMPKDLHAESSPRPGCPRPENPSPLPNYRASTIMTRYRGLKDKRKPNKPCREELAPFLSDSSEMLSGKRSRPHSTPNRPRNFRVQ